MTPFVLETPRLQLRPFEFSDAAALFEMDGNPNVHRYLGNRPLSSQDECLAYIETVHEQYARHGIGRFAVVLKETGAVAGWAGLKFITEPENGHTDFYDIGYRLQEKHWGKGYALEAAIAWRDHAFELLSIPRLYASAHIDNGGSNAILRKLGMRPDGTFDWNGLRCNWYSLKNPNP